MLNPPLEGHGPARPSDSPNWHLVCVEFEPGRSLTVQISRQPVSVDCLPQARCRRPPSQNLRRTRDSQLSCFLGGRSRNAPNSEPRSIVFASIIPVHSQRRQSPRSHPICKPNPNRISHLEAFDVRAAEGKVKDGTRSKNELASHKGCKACNRNQRQPILAAMIRTLVRIGVRLRALSHCSWTRTASIAAITHKLSSSGMIALSRSPARMQAMTSRASSLYPLPA